jgi:hypothetical protein
MNSYCKQIHIFTNTLTSVPYEFSLYMNSYIKSKASKEATASISDDLEGNMKAVLEEETSDVVEASVSDTPAVMTVTPMFASTVSSVVAVSANKEGVRGLIAAIL